MRNLQATRTLFELSRPGRGSDHLARCDVPEQPIDQLMPARWLASQPPAIPEVAEPEVVRHFTNLSTMNMAIDTHFYPLGSCTMKHNPKRNERLAALPGLAHVHPLQPDETVQGLLAVLFALQSMLAEISGLPGVSLQPAAGAQGELASLMIAAAHFRQRGETRRKVLIPDSSHGTNAASATMAGFETVTVGSNARGLVDLEQLQRHLSPDVAVFMFTNPNTLGLFDDQVERIAELVHAHGALLYLDGANMNAILGKARPGDFGADMMHFNPHKTFSGPHGGGGPGAGPICVSALLEPYLPVPVVVRDQNRFRLAEDRPLSIGKVRGFTANVGVLVRAYAYLRTHGSEGLREVAEQAVLNANYLLSRVRHILPVPYGDRCMHEFVASAEPLKKQKGISAMDLAKRLLDFGFHAPTVYFPLTVSEAVMVEPTETESKQTLDAFAEALFRITEESLEWLQDAPHSTVISRPDEVQAARKPLVRWSDAAES